MVTEKRALRGRLIRRQICDSRSVARLIDTRGPWAGLLFERMILWGDDEGRFVAEPGIVKAHCLPWHTRKESDIWKDLQVMHLLGMVYLYQQDKVKYGVFPNWDRHQRKPPPDRFLASTLPSPPETFRLQVVTEPEPEEIQTDNETLPSCVPESKSESESEVTLRVGESASPPSPKHKAPEGYSEAIKAYHEGFFATYGTKPRIGADDGNLLKRALASEPLPKVLDVIGYGVSGQDEFLLKNPPTLKALLGDGLFTKIAGTLGRKMKEQNRGA